MTPSPEADRVVAALADVLGRNLTEDDAEIADWFAKGWTAKAMEQGEPLAASRGRGPKPGDWAT